MGKRIPVWLLGAITIALATSCISTASDTTRPAWTDSDWRTEFPEARYLAERGIAGTEEQSKTEALAALSRYISTTVNASLQSSVHSISQNNSVNEAIDIKNETYITSNIQLFGIEFTEPFYLKTEKKWYCVAYVFRDSAWEQYVPQIEVAKETFYGFYQRAQHEQEPLTACTYYAEAWEAGKNFLSTLEYGRLLHPLKESMYSSDRATVSGIPSLISAKKKTISIAVNIQGDKNDIIGSAVSAALKQSEFTVSPNGNYTANIVISSNESGSDPIAIWPSVSIQLAGVTGEILWSYQGRLQEKTTAYTLENAQKKAYPKLAEQIKEAIRQNFTGSDYL